MENLFKKQSAKFNLNRLSFTEVMVKTFLVCFFYAPQCSNGTTATSSNCVIHNTFVMPAKRHRHFGQVNRFYLLTYTEMLQAIGETGVHSAQTTIAPTLWRGFYPGGLSWGLLSGGVYWWRFLSGGLWFRVQV